jgi:predicted house-cleaning noncanonical NTP pyrophosphatase (MazG superfamily)
MKYNKLVRDKIPESIENSGKKPVVRISEEEEYWEKLKEKLAEEVKEYNENENPEELADILEVVEAICSYKKIDKNVLLKLKKEKAEKKGKFKDKIILEEVN